MNGALAAVVWLVAPLPLLGFALGRLRRPALARWLAWSLVVLVTVSVERLTRGQPPPLRMLAVIAALFFSMKGVVGVEEPLPWRRWLRFCLLWPGMQPAAFRERRDGLIGAAALARGGALRLLAGVALVLAARPLPVLLAPLLLLPGLSLILHFGLFDLAAAYWRFRGFAVAQLFRAPWRSRGLAEFWGRRWNLAFVEMLTLAVYRPLAAVSGRGGAAFAAFALSGLLHELAISLPVGTGYGGPALYFALHGGLVLLERRTGVRSRTLTLLALLLPAPILFHPAFLRGVILPVIGR